MKIKLKEDFFNIIRLQKQNSIDDVKLEFKIEKQKHRYNKHNLKNKILKEDFILQSNNESEIINDYIKSNVTLKNNFYKYIRRYLGIYGDEVDGKLQSAIYLDECIIHLDIKYVLINNSLYISFKIKNSIKCLDPLNCEIKIENPGLEMFSEKDQIKLLESNNIEYSRDHKNIIVVCKNLSEKEIIWPKFDECDLYHEEESLIVYIEQENRMTCVSIINNETAALSVSGKSRHGMEKSNFDLFWILIKSKKLITTINKFRDQKVEIKRFIAAALIPIIYSVLFFVLKSNKVNDILESTFSIAFLMLFLAIMVEAESKLGSRFGLSMYFKYINQLGVFAISSLSSIAIFLFLGSF
jgi:hypothetical protein